MRFRTLALATALSSSLVAPATHALAAQLGPGHQQLAAPRGEITGTITFNRRWIPGGFNSGVCRDFKVVAQNAAERATSGRMHASLYQKTVSTYSAGTASTCAAPPP